MANISKIKLPNDVTYDIKDNNALKSVNVSGSGNAITNASVSGTDVNFTKGETFSKSDHTHTNVTTTDPGFMTASDKVKLDGISAGAEVNQNAFSNVTVGVDTITADSKTDTLTFVAGTNVTLTPDTANDTITINALGTITGVSVDGTSVATSGVADITSIPVDILNGIIPIIMGGTGATTADAAIENLGLKKPVKVADNWGLNTSVTFADIGKYTFFIGKGEDAYVWYGVKSKTGATIPFTSRVNTTDYMYNTYQSVTINGTTLKTPSSCITYRNNSKQTNNKVLGEVWAIC